MRILGIALLVAALALLGDPVAAPAQDAGPASGSLRPYGHVFLAYAAAWVVVLAWVVHIGRRLARVERSLGDRSE